MEIQLVQLAGDEAIKKDKRAFIMLYIIMVKQLHAVLLTKQDFLICWSCIKEAKQLEKRNINQR